VCARKCRDYHVYCVLEAELQLTIKWLSDPTSEGVKTLTEVVKKRATLNIIKEHFAKGFHMAAKNAIVR